MTEIIAANPELRGVFASNLIMAQGAAQAVAESQTNKTGDKINLVGFDEDDQLVKFLQDGTIAAHISPQSGKSRRFDFNGYKRLADISECRDGCPRISVRGAPPSWRSGAGFRQLASLPRRSGCRERW